jgi:hypothetical protein
MATHDLAKSVADSSRTYSTCFNSGLPRLTPTRLTSGGPDRLVVSEAKYTFYIFLFLSPSLPLSLLTASILPFLTNCFYLSFFLSFLSPISEYLCVIFLSSIYPPPPLPTCSYEVSTGLYHCHSIRASTASPVGRFSSVERFPQGGLFGASIGGDDVGPGSYDSYLRESCFFAASALSPRVGSLNSSAFGSCEKKNQSRQPQDDNEDLRVSTWSLERDREQFWRHNAPKWGKPDGKVRGAPIIKSDGPDVLMYDIDQTRAVTKYQPLATLAGCKDLSARAMGMKKKSMSCPSLLNISNHQILNIDLSGIGIEDLGSISSALIDESVASAKRSMRMPFKQSPHSASPTETRGSTFSPGSTRFPDPFSPSSMAPTPMSLVRSNQSSQGFQFSSMALPHQSYSIRMFDNRITSLDGMLPLLDRITQNHCEYVKNIDLSFNQIHSLKLEQISALSNLSTLNLCSNGVSSFRTVKEISGMTSLRQLNLIDNPIQVCKSYRTKVIGLMPFLKKLDNSVITKIEYHLSALWFDKKKSGKMQQEHPGKLNTTL